jgi:hypothetical protein
MLLYKMIRRPRTLKSAFVCAYLSQQVRKMDGNLVPSMLPYLHLAPEAPMRFERQLERGIVSWESFRARRINFAYALPAHVTIFSAAQILRDYVEER